MSPDRLSGQAALCICPPRRSVHSLPAAARAQEVNLHGGFAVDPRPGHGQIYYGMPGCGILRVDPDLQRQEIIRLPDNLGRSQLPQHQDRPVRRQVAPLPPRQRRRAGGRRHPRGRRRLHPAAPGLRRVPVARQCPTSRPTPSWSAASCSSPTATAPTTSARSTSPRSVGPTSSAARPTSPTRRRQIRHRPRPQLQPGPPPPGHRRPPPLPHPGPRHRRPLYRLVQAAPGAWPCGISYAEYEGRWYAAIGCLLDPEEGRPAPIYIVDAQSYALLSIDPAQGRTRRRAGPAPAQCPALQPRRPTHLVRQTELLHSS